MRRTIKDQRHLLLDRPFRALLVLFMLLVVSSSPAEAGEEQPQQKQFRRKRVVGMSTRQGMHQGNYARFYRSSRGVVVNQPEVAAAPSESGSYARTESQLAQEDNLEGSLERREMERRARLRR